MGDSSAAGSYGCGGSRGREASATSSLLPEEVEFWYVSRHRSKTLRLSPEDLAELRQEMTRIARNGSSIESIARDLVDYLFGRVRDEQGEPALALVRFFKTHLYSDLPVELRAWADRSAPGADRPEWLRCLTLLATRGAQPAWCRCEDSVAHRAVPLMSEEMVREAPMIAQLIREFGLSIATVVHPDPDLIVEATRTYGIFHVTDAPASPYIPAQEEFVIPHGIRSVLGFGGLLPNADLWTIIMFARVPISKRSAESFKRIASGLTVTMIPFADKTFRET